MSGGGDSRAGRMAASGREGLRQGVRCEERDERCGDRGVGREKRGEECKPNWLTTVDRWNAYTLSYRV